MRYFIVELDEGCADAPVIINWFEKLDVRLIRPNTAHLLPRRLILDIRANADTVFTDVISKPFFLCSDKVLDALNVYKHKVPHKQIVLLDSKNSLTALYYLPLLETVDCLSDKSELSRDGSVVRRAVLDAAKLPDRCIFKLGGTRGTFVIITLDLAESLLRRGARGITLRHVEITR